MAGVREIKAITKRQLQQRDLLWPGAAAYIWDRKANKGFATIPKTMPIILQLMDDMSGGKPLASTYLGLWCGTWDNSMVNTSKQQEFAHSAGFTGQRAVYTWAQRMKILHELRFIDIKPGSAGDISHVLMLNPHQVIRWHHKMKTAGLTAALFNAMIERAMEIGADDALNDGPDFPPVLDVAPPAPPVPPPPPAKA